MKIQFKEYVTPTIVKKYPYLGKNVSTGNVVLFIGKDMGVYVSVSENSTYKVGEASSLFNERSFDAIKGEVFFKFD